MTSNWSRIFDRLRRPGEAQGPVEAIPDPWSNAPSDPERETTPIHALLDEIEAAGRAVYAAHGLPDQPGHYARSARSPHWRFVSETLTAEERWALVTAQKPGSGWRFGALEDLGDQPDSPPDLKRAAGLLRACRQLRGRLAEAAYGLGEDLEAALRLGVEWTTLTSETPAEVQPQGLPEPRPDEADPSSATPAPKPADDFLIPPSDDALASPKPKPAAKPKGQKTRRPRAKTKPRAQPRPKASA